MSHPRRFPVVAAGAATLALAGVAALPAGADAAGTPFNCDASALRGQLLSSPAIEPVTANRNQAACATVKSPTTIDLSATGLPAVAGVLSAATVASGTADQQKALATGGLANLAIGTPAALKLPDVASLVPASANKISIPLSSLGVLYTTVNTLLTTAGQQPLPASLDIDLTDAIKSLLPALPDVPVLSVAAATAYAGASCQNGRAVPFGTSSVAGVKVLGQDVGANGLLNAVLPVLDGSTIDLSKLDVTKIALPDVLTKALPLSSALLPAVQNLLKQALANVKIPLPAQVANVSITPNTQTTSGGVLTQHALDVKISLLGQSVVDATLGEARVNTSGVDCSAATAPTTASDLALACTSRKIVLTDVYEDDGRVKLLGAADKKFAGQTVAIRFEGTGRTAAHAKVAADGSFATTAALPPKRLRATNRARYVASIGSQKSLDLKLRRRMQVTGTRSSGGKVTISGRISRPLGKPVQSVTLQRRLSCKKLETVKRFKPGSNGSFHVTVAAPEGQTAAVYRLTTKVRKTTRNKKLFKTFTLPRGVNLKQ